MFHSAVEAAQKSWYFYEPLTLLSTYKNFQKKFIESFSPYEYLVKNYRIKTNRQIYPLTIEYLDDNPHVAEENVALLKNAIELWRSASHTSDSVAPILFHYSWHCFNSFFVYTFFRWEPQHSASHGIHISNFTDNMDEIKITVSKDGNGLFQRLVDAWTCLGGSLAFSSYLPTFEKEKIEFQPNQLYFLEESNCFSLAQLLSFNPVKDYARKYKQIVGKEKLVHNPSLSNSMIVPTRILQNYLILFVASSVARYRPILWSSALSGDTNSKVVFALAYRQALLIYAQFGVNSLSLLQRFSFLISDLMQGKFKLKKMP